MANTTQGTAAQEQALVPTFRATIGGIEQTCVDARFLHAYLQNGDHFAGWINARLQKYGFEEGGDYECVSEKTETQRANGQRGVTIKKDYRLTLDMAKELSMVENNDRGREARRYFIAMERQALGMSQAPAARPEPQPAPAAAREKLNAADMQHMKRIVWFAGRNFHSQESATQGIWYYLRQITHNPAPNAYGVDHIPVLAAELRRVLALCDQVGQITRGIEAQAVKRIFRQGETADKVLAQLAAEAARSVKQLNDHVAEFPTWMEGDLLSFTERAPAYHGAAYTPEQPDFFLSVA